MDSPLFGFKGAKDLCKRDQLSHICFLYAFLSRTAERPLLCRIKKCFSLNALVKGGVGQMLTKADEGGGGVSKTPKLAEITCDCGSPLNRSP